ncbi:AfsR/SARP family transcriptional regulator [Arthrobacter mobilis]|uniref:SARP family transcriptional regulator n=1 Tax=Arthrobacter mobilis TaxID=2724944 RepID=A0A7X6HCC6_9MICC|nr:BTAD domain-containing putative transcriptional regulator [Arthrobacter mobilis]NKX54507.1 SARP family transcriptional regulator [Arthrobacter mobilis]
MTSNSSWEIRLLGGWHVFNGRRPVRVTFRQQRLIAVLALYGSQPRSFLAGTLWPNSSEKQATGSLRESIWMVSHQLPGLLVEGRDPLGLAPEVTVDVHALRRQAAELERSPGGRGDKRRAELLEALRTAELLPGWYEDWVTAEQERWNQLRLTALERLAAQFLENGQTGQAVDAAACAIAIEPLRESSQRLLLEAHLAEGNYAQALRSYAAFSSRLLDEFGVEPSARISELIGPLKLVGGGARGASRRKWPEPDHGFEDAGTAGRARAGGWLAK